MKNTAVQTGCRQALTRACPEIDAHGDSNMREIRWAETFWK